MTAADLGDGGPVALGRLHGAQRRSHDRFRHECGDRGRAGARDRPVELVGELGGIAQRVGSRVAGTVRVGGGHVAETPQPALVRAAQRLAPGQVERAERVPVIAAPAREHREPVRLATGDLRAPGELERGLDRLGTATDRVQVRLVEREMGAQLRRVPLQWLRGECGAVGIGQARRLVRDHLGDLTTAVADVDDDRATGRIEILPAVRVNDRGTVRGDGDGRVGDRRPAEDVPAHARAGVVWVLTRRL